MSQTQEAWNEVGERFASWGRQVADRYKQAGGTSAEAAKETQRRLEDAAREVTDVLDRAFTALGDTIRDEGAKTDLKAAVKSVGDAVAVTVTEAGEQIRKRVGGTPPPQGPSAGPDEGPSNPA